MKLQLGKFEIESSGDSVKITVNTTLGNKVNLATITLTRFEAIRVRNWLNDFINGREENE